MYFSGIGTAVPAHRYSQLDCWNAIQLAPQFADLSTRAKSVVEKVLLGDNGIEHRHFPFADPAEAFQLNPDALHRRFADTAPELAERAAREALNNAGLQPGDIDGLVISTCTGYLCPGLSSYVSERLGLNTDVAAVDLVGQGCVAALPNLRTANTMLASGEHERVLSICVEVCSAAFYLDNDPGVLISACLFGDGAGAAVLTRANGHPGKQLEWLAARSLLSTGDRDYLRFEQKDGMLRNILHRRVPTIAGDLVARLLADTLAENNVSQADLNAYIWHAGGRDVLSVLKEKLGLGDHDVRYSASVLRDFGNVSSACVYFVLQRALAGDAAPGHWWLGSFGAGFSCQGALLRMESHP